MPFAYRPYTPADYAPLLAILRLNIPQAFAEEEVADFDAFLSKLPGPYYVVELTDQLMGACGYTLLADQPDTARICWIFTDPTQQRRGVGRFILTTIETELRALPGVRTIDVRTSQVAYRFFEKHGYVLTEIRPDYWTPGFDLYWMRKAI